MKLLFTGLRRRVVEHCLIGGKHADISKLDPLDDGGFDPRIRTSETNWHLDKDEVEIVKRTRLPIDLSYGSNYEISIRLNKDEIANLARIAFGNDRFLDVVYRISGSHTEGAPT